MVTKHSVRPTGYGLLGQLLTNNFDNLSQDEDKLVKQFNCLKSFIGLLGLMLVMEKLLVNLYEKFLIDS